MFSRCRTIGGLAFLFLLPAANAAPRIVCPEPEYTFGVMEDTNNVEHVFAIRNEGDAPLTIGNVRACCGATATIATNSIAPGSNASLRVVFSLRGRNGEQHKSVYVASNDPQSPYLQLRLTGKAAPALNIQPSYIDFGTLRRNQATNVEVVVAGNREGALQITNAVVDTGQLAVDWQKGESQNVWRVRISTRPPLAIGATNALVTLLSNHPEHPKIRIPVRMAVLSDLMIVPPEILISPGTQVVTRCLSIKSRSGKPFRVLKITPPNPQITVACEPIASSYRIRLENVLPRQDLNGGRLVIATDLDEAEPAAVPFRIVAP